MILRDYGILRAETACIRALPPALGASLRRLSPLPEGGCESNSVLFIIVNFPDSGYFDKSLA